MSMVRDLDMPKLNSVFGAIGAIVMLLYGGGLLYYFADFDGSTQKALRDGIGPALIAVGAVGLLFCVPFIVRIAGRRSTGPKERGEEGLSKPGGEGRLDADALV